MAGDYLGVQESKLPPSVRSLLAARRSRITPPITGGEGETMNTKTASSEPSGGLDGYLPFRDVSRLSSTRFRHDNMLRLVSPTDYEHSADCLLHIRVLPPWRLVGWSDRIDARLMRGREGQVGIMFWHPMHGNVWEHHPLVDEDERDNAIFVSR